MALETIAPPRRPVVRARGAVVHLPRIANFTDDLLVLPGSKNTIADLRHLKARGFAATIRPHAERGGTSSTRPRDAGRVAAKATLGRCETARTIGWRMRSKPLSEWRCCAVC